MKLKKLLALTERARHMGLRGTFSHIWPARVSVLLYEVRYCEGSVTLDGEVQVRRYDAASRSTWPLINTPIAGARALYIVADGDVVAHHSFLVEHMVTPAAFGFDPSVPVVADCKTHPDYRGRGYFPCMLRYISQDLKEREGKELFYALVSPNNTASIRGLEKAGARRKAWLKGWRVLTFGWPRPK